jgi:glutathione S-transferase
MKLWSGVLSPFSAKVRIALAEKQLAYETLPMPWSRKTLWGPKPPEFLAVSPRGQVPVLIDGDTVVYDSTVICEYLEDRYPRPPLFPDGAAERARCRQLEDEADLAMSQDVTALVQELFTKAGGGAAPDMARVGAATDALRRRYDALDEALRGRDYLCDRFSIADVATYLVIGYATTLGVPPTERHERLAAWGERLRGRPTIGRELDAITQAAAAA